MTDVEIIVIGDVYWDTVVIPLPGGKSDSNPLQPAYARIERPGGAWLLQSMIEAATGGTVQVRGYQQTRVDECRRALTVLKLFSQDDKDKKNKVYRVEPKQKFVWVAPPVVPSADGSAHFSNNKDRRKVVYDWLNECLMSNPQQSTKRIVVINETRDHDFCTLAFDDAFLNKLLPSDSWLSYHMANPSPQDGKNNFWNLIQDKKKDVLKRTVVILSAASLRSAGFHIDQQAAQETIAEDLVRWLKSSKDLPWDSCSDCSDLPAHLIVRFDFDTVFHFRSLNEPKKERWIDIYSRPFDVNPQSNEALFGKMPGYGRILVASIVKRLAEPSKGTLERDIREGICDGLKRMEAHFRNGFASEEHGKNHRDSSTPFPLPFENLFKCDLDLLFKDYPRDDYNNIGNSAIIPLT